MKVIKTENCMHCGMCMIEDEEGEVESLDVCPVNALEETNV